MDEQLQAIKNMVTTWYERYRNMERDESTIVMFIDVVNRLAETYLAQLYRTKSISPDDYSEMMAYLEELVAKLKKEFGYENTMFLWDHIRGC